MDELRRRAALLGGGAALVGRRCFMLDVQEVAAAQEAGQEVEGAHGWLPPASAWVEARVQGWDERYQLLRVSADWQGRGMVYCSVEG